MLLSEQGQTSHCLVTDIRSNSRLQDSSHTTMMRGQGNVWLAQHCRPDAQAVVALEQLPDDNLAAASAGLQQLLSTVVPAA